MAKFIPNWNCHYWVSQQTELTQSKTPPTAITDSIILSKGTWSIKTDFLHKEAAFLQKYVFVKKQYFYNRLICKKAAFLHKKAAFLQKYIFVKKQYFYNRLICKNAAFLQKYIFVKK